MIETQYVRSTSYTSRLFEGVVCPITYIMSTISMNECLIIHYIHITIWYCIIIYIHAIDYNIVLYMTAWFHICDCHQSYAHKLHRSLRSLHTQNWHTKQIRYTYYIAHYISYWILLAVNVLSICLTAYWLNYYLCFLVILK